jgi:Cysteine-rich secretory protein family
VRVARIAPSLLAALATVCALALTGAATADAHSRSRHRANGCARAASYHSRHPAHRVSSRRCNVRRPTHPASRPHAPQRQLLRRHGGRSSDAGCPGAGATPTASNLELIRGAVLCLEDRERAAHGEAPLHTDAALQSAAQSHSEDMTRNGYFAHDGPDGTPLQRVRAAGYIRDPGAAYEVGENLAWGTLWLATPRAIVSGWMASAGHRANILDGRFRDTAVGVAVDLPRSLSGGQPGGMYTQDFGVVAGS